jgi:hypothetical protein
VLGRWCPIILSILYLVTYGACRHLRVTLISRRRLCVWRIREFPESWRKGWRVEDLLLSRTQGFTTIQRMKISEDSAEFRSRGVVNTAGEACANKHDVWQCVTFRKMIKGRLVFQMMHCLLGTRDGKLGLAARSSTEMKYANERWKARSASVPASDARFKELRQPLDNPQSRRKSSRSTQH